MKKILTLALVMSMSLTAEATGTADCADAPLSELDRWARATVSSSTRGVALPNGTIVDESCLAGLDATARGRRIARIRAAVDFASDQATRCHEAFRLPDPTNVPGTLARTRLRCSDLGDNVNAQAATTVDHGWCPTQRLLGALITTPHYERSYEVEITTRTSHALDVGDIDSLASTLFHETLHFSSNNRIWHNEPTAAHTGSGCANSLYTDRVYFLTAACFPNSPRGRQFRANAPEAAPAGCANVCDEALGTIDQAAIDEYSHVYGARGLIASPLTAGDRRIICGRITASSRRAREVLPELRHDLRMAERALSTLPRAAIFETMIGREIAVATKLIPFSGYTPARTPEAAVAELRASRARIDAELNRRCASGADPAPLTSAQNYDLCTTQRIRIGGAYDTLTRALLRFNAEDYLIYRTADDPAP
ncbi:MAG: hypothetical protein IT285_01485 [Bdellovibrionales bacterium]|nr:hypothetical protein [Bdellovibrionales bacterium]